MTSCDTTCTIIRAQGSQLFVVSYIIFIVKRVVCNEVFKDHLKQYLNKIGMDLQEDITEKDMDDAFEKAEYDYTEVEVECKSLQEFPRVSRNVGERFEYPNDSETPRDYTYDKAVSYTEGEEHTQTKISEWNICGGLSAEYQGVGLTGKVGYTKRQSETVTNTKTTTETQTIKETVSVPPKTKVEVAIVQHYQRKECKVKNVKLIFPKGVKIKCKVFNRQNKKDKKHSIPIEEVLEDYLDHKDADPLTARLDGKYIWVETKLSLEIGKPVHV